MNVFARMTDRVRSSVETLAKSGAFSVPQGLDRVIVEPPREADHGELATNAAMVLAKEIGWKPRDLAEKIAVELRKFPEVVKAEIAGPGFINLMLDAGMWRSELKGAIEAGKDYGSSKLGKDEPVNVE